MPTGILKNYVLGLGGVNVDDNPLMLDDSELQRAQNAVHDPTGAHRKGLRKRPGLERFNTVPLTGPILGGIAAPVAGTGGAPQTISGGSGAAGTSGDTTSVGGVSPEDPTAGAGSSVPSTSGVSSAGAFPGSANSGLFGGSRILVIGRYTNAGPGNQTGQGWYVTSEKFQNAPTLRTGTPGPAGMDSGFVGELPPPAVVYNGVLYYAKAIDNQASPSLLASIRATDGFSDTLVAQVPQNPAIVNGDGSLKTSQQADVLSMAIAAGNIYFGMRDANIVASDTLNSDVGRIFQFVPATGLMGQPNLPATVNGVAPANILPLAMTAHNSQLWIGGSLSNGVQRSAFVYPSQFVESAALELILTRPYYQVSAMCSYNGSLYVGFWMLSAAGHAITHGHIYAMASSWASGGSPWTDVQTLSGGTAVDNNFVPSMVVFNGKLYVSYYNPDAPKVSKIYSFDGTTWSVVLTATELTPFYLTVDNGILYAIGTNVSFTAAVKAFLYSVDGTTWVDQTTLMADGVNTAGPIPVVFGYNQR